MKEPIPDSEIPKTFPKNWKKMTPREVSLYNALQVVSQLKKSNIKSVELEFDGSGDDGQINDITTESIKKGDTADLKNIQVTLIEVPNGWDTFGSEPPKEKSNKAFKKTAEEYFEDLVFEKLSEKFSGWEINEGSYGKFTFDVTSGMEVSFGWRTVEDHEIHEEWPAGKRAAIKKIAKDKKEDQSLEL
jgi:hypothetical protein